MRANAASEKVSETVNPIESRTTAIRVIGVSTLSAATPVIAPAVARTCVEPSPTPVATPPTVIVAIADEVVVQVMTGCATSGTPSPSTALAVKGAVPLRYTLREPGVTLIVARRCWTTMREESRVPPASLATTQLVPSATAVTRPAASTVATAGVRETQVKTPGTTALAASRAVATSVRAPPIAVSVSKAGATVVDATPPPALLASTVIGEPVRPVAVTVIDCAPTAAPSVQVTLASPAALVFAVAAETDPLTTAKPTLNPAIGFENASVTRMTIGCGSTVLGDAT